MTHRSLHPAVLGTAVAVALTACVPEALPARGGDIVRTEVYDAELHLQAPAAEVVAQLGARFEARGAHLVGQHDAVDGSGDRLYVFKSERPPIVLGAIDETCGEIATYRTGSVFYASLHANRAGSVDLLLLGKPTYDGVDLCSDADVLLRRFEYWCVDTRLHGTLSGPLLRAVRGADEAEAVRGVLLELEGRLGAAAGG